MDFIGEYGSTIFAAALGTVVGGIALGVILHYGQDLPLVEQAHNGFGG